MYKEIILLHVYDFMVLKSHVFCENLFYHFAIFYYEYHYVRICIVDFTNWILSILDAKSGLRLGFSVFLCSPMGEYIAIALYVCPSVHSYTQIDTCWLL